MDADYLGLLSGDERAIIVAADAMLRQPLPTLDAEKMAYAQRNLSLQSDLNGLRMSHGFNCSTLISRLRQREFVLRRDAREDGARDKDERNCAIHCDAQWRDLSLTVDRTTAVMRRAESLEWMLKNALEFVRR